MDIDEVLDELRLRISSFGVDSLVPIECQDFFISKIIDFKGSQSDCIAYIVEQTPRWFRFLNSMPDWIQHPDWQFDNGKPMLFVGQIQTRSPFGGQDSVFFLFWNPDNGETKVVHQIY